MNRSLLALACCCLLLPPAALGQAFELDLSDDAPAKPPPKKKKKGTEPPPDAEELPDPLGGLDLTGDDTPPRPEVPQDLKPTIAIVGTVAGDPDAVTRDRAALISAELARLAGAGDLYSTIVDADLAASKLGAGHAAVLACADWPCFEKAAKDLGVSRVLVAEVKKAGAGSSVSLKGFDPGLNEIVGASQDSDEKAERKFAGFAGTSQAKKNKDFVKKMGGFLNNALAKLSTPNGRLEIDNNETTATVSVDGVVVGVGAVEAVVQRGLRKVAVNGADFKPFEVQVTVGPAEVVPVKVSLIAKPLNDGPPILVKQAPTTGTPMLQRPGLYVAAAGVATAAVGVVLGVLAKGAEGRARDTNGDGIVELTRREALDAQAQASMANILMGAGGAVAAGGAVWFFLTPAPPPTAKETSVEGGGFGVVAGVGGTF